MTQIDEGQATIHTAPPEDGATHQTHNVDAHMPPQPKPDEGAQQDPVWAVPHWNPETNEWAPSNEQHETWGVAEPAHTDDPNAMPVSESYGQASSGTVPEAGMNLIDAVKARSATAAPVIEHHHIVETQEVSSTLARARTIRVQAQVAGAPNSAVILLEENPYRDRALIKIITANGQLLISPIRRGGNQPQLGAAAGNLTGFVLSVADGTFEVKSGAGVECVLSNATAQAFADVTIWEEIRDTAPGLQ